MARGPRTPRWIAAVTRTIERVNAERRNVRQRSTGSQGVHGIEPLQPEVRALAAQIVAVLEGEGQRITRPADRVMIELFATALALVRTCLTQDEALATASRALSAASNRSPGVRETGEIASVRGDGIGGRGIAGSSPDAPSVPAGMAEDAG